VFILPSARGYVFGTALVAMLIGAINYGSNLAHLLVFLLAGLGLVAAVHTHRNLAGLSVLAGRAEPVFAGGAATLRVCLENPTGLPRHAVAVEYRASYGTSPPSRWQRVAGAVPPGDGTCLELEVPAPRRGRLRLVRLRLASGFPLGLYRCWAPFHLEASCLVYPQPAGDLPLPPLEPAPHGTQRQAGGDEDFAGLREYRPGDPPRRVHWKAAARGHALPVKLFAGGETGDRVLRWDEAGRLDTEGRLSQLARWALEAERAGHCYGLDLPGLALPPDCGERHLHACLEALALFGGADG
jgi:uncharacterized protein (DUF58 family)